MTITWVEEVPAEPDNQYYRRQRFLRELKQAPDKWAIYQPGKGHHQSVASRWRLDFPGVEAVARPRLDGDGYDIYVRWVGP